MSSSATGRVQGPRSGHLDAAWEVAVVSAFIIVFVALVSVVIFQVRRRRRRQRDLEETSSAQLRRRNPNSTCPKIQERDLEKGIDMVDPAEGDIETESESEDTPEPKQKKKSKTKPSRPRTKAKQNSRSKGQKSNSSTSSSSHKAIITQPSSSDYYFEHPSEKPPKYYWDPQ